jgi:hypothetical protein
MSTQEQPDSKPTSGATPRLGQILLRQGHLTEERLSTALTL